MTGTAWLDAFLMGACVCFGVLILLALLRAMRGPRFTDRFVAVNLIGTITIVIMCLLGVYFQQAFLMDIAMIYALLSFIAVVVLSRLVIVRRRAQEQKERAEAEAEASANASAKADGENAADRAAVQEEADK